MAIPHWVQIALLVPYTWGVYSLIGYSTVDANRTVGYDHVDVWLCYDAKYTRAYIATIAFPHWVQIALLAPYT